MLSHRIDLATEKRQGVVECSQQGRCLKTKVSFKNDSDETMLRAKRGKVVGFSRASRKRFIEDIQRLDSLILAGLEPKFLTLTYRHDIDVQTAKKNLRALFERIRRRWPKSSGYWRLELQGRGVWHFHLLLFGVPYLHQSVWQRWWEKIVQHDLKSEGSHLFVNIKAVRSVKQLTNYVSKYAAKMVDSASFLDNVSYLHAGRWWGKFNASSLPYAAAQRMILPLGKWFFIARRAAKKIYKKINKTNQLGIKGFSLYMEQSLGFFDWVQDIFMQNRMQYTSEF